MLLVVQLANAPSCKKSVSTLRTISYKERRQSLLFLEEISMLSKKKSTKQRVIKWSIELVVIAKNRNVKKITVNAMKEGSHVTINVNVKTVIILEPNVEIIKEIMAIMLNSNRLSRTWRLLLTSLEIPITKIKK